MNTVQQNNHVVIVLEATRTLTVTADAVSSATVWAFGNGSSDEPGRPTSVADGSETFGPYSSRQRFDLVVEAGSASFDTNVVDFPTLAETIEASGNATLIENDILELVGSGAPVDYTDGDPAATGEGVAGPGSRYTDVDTVTLYLNTGTKAEPTWTALAFVS